MKGSIIPVEMEEEGLLRREYVLVGVVICWLQPEAQSQAKPGPKKPGQAGPK